MGYYNAGIGAARINDSSPSDYTTYSGNKIETKQNATDNTLTTTSKNIVGAINEINSKVNNKFIIVQTLPVSDIDEFAIYLIPKSTSQTDNIYDEYIYISTDTPAHWEKIGDTEIDLSGYYTSSQVDTLLNNKQDAADNNLDTVDKHINGAINELHTINGYSYDAYDDTSTYAVGDLCIYNNALYKCTTAITTAEAWNASHWTATNIADEISRIDTALSGKADYSEVTTPTLNNQYIDVSDSWFYVRKIGNFCYINGRLKLTSAVSNNYGLVFNMPLATANSLMMVFVSGRDFNNKANTFIVSCVVSNGTLTIQTYPDSIESGKYLYINGFYACQ